MKIIYFESIIIGSMSVYNEELRNNIENVCKEYGFNLNLNDGVYKSFAKDNLYDLIKHRTIFILKRLREIKEYQIINYKIRGIIDDSEIGSII